MLDFWRKVAGTILLLLCLLLNGCYVTPPTSDNPQDPFQHFNRDTTRFNTKIDNLIIKPAAKKYQQIIPYQARQSIGNFFDNLEEPEDVSNDILQGHVRWALNDSWHFLINSTVGLLGLFNPASHIDLQEHENDFGLTVNTWGIYSAYFVLPIIGPRTIDSALAIPADYYLGLEQYLIPLNYSIVMSMLYGINVRADLLTTEQNAGGLIFDRYLFYRSAYLQYRAYLLKTNQQGPTYSFEQLVAADAENQNQ